MENTKEEQSKLRMLENDHVDGLIKDLRERVFCGSVSVFTLIERCQAKREVGSGIGCPAGEGTRCVGAEKCDGIESRINPEHLRKLKEDGEKILSDYQI
ncbi:MAG: hypothetical protein FWD89_04265 [Firmicutes bacterium]|nr:hypothetical protein [Bacillota bacterium]